MDKTVVEVGKSEFLQLQQAHDFEPFQIQCKADGAVLLEHFLARAGSVERHICHRDLEFVERNKERILQGQHIPLAIGGQLVEIDTTTLHSFNYEDLLQRVRVALLNMLSA